MEGEIDHIVQTAIRRERKVWGLTLVLMMIGMQFIHLQTTVQPSISGSEVSKYTMSSQEMPSLGRRRLMEASSPTGESMLARAPAAEKMEALIEKEDDEEAETLNQTRAEPMNCSCPPGPRGPAGEPAPEFLSSIFSWDPERQALTIRASTVELDGHIIVNGFAGIRQTVFVGGDPSAGESSTEVSPGSLLLYKSGMSPTIAGFQTGEDGYKTVPVTVIGGLEKLDEKTAVSEGL